MAENPYCCYCEADGRPYVPADIVDHIEPHRGDPVKFWDVENWQSLCKLHHDSAKQAQEKGGNVRGCNADGLPIDKAHHWHD